MTHVPPPLERDCAGSPCSKLLFRIKREAKILKKATGLKHSAALDQIAQKAGFCNFQDAQRKCEAVLTAEPGQSEQMLPGGTHRRKVESVSTRLSERELEWRRVLQGLMRRDLGPLLLVKGEFNVFAENSLSVTQYFTEDGQQVFLRPEDVCRYSYRPLRKGEEDSFVSLQDLIQKVGLDRGEIVSLNLPIQPRGSSGLSWRSASGSIIELSQDDLRNARSILVWGGFEPESESGGH
ncbi:hypothetical protein ACYPKM_01130 [Pseudomonas aeruginosa]